MYKRLLNLPLARRHSIFLFGPRGTGKTAWIRENMPDALYIDLLDFSTYSFLNNDPSRLETTMIPQNFDGWVVIDEVQRIPELLNQVQRLIELRKIPFLLTGSSARGIKRRGTNLLAGRAFTFHMHPLVIQEIYPEVPFSHILRYGMLPLAITQEDPELYLRSYVDTYVREEVLQEGLTRNIGAFTSFLEAASFSQAQTINVSAVARELGINRLVVSSYFDILEDLLLAERIPIFSLRAKRRIIAHSKFFFFDAGFFQFLRPRGFLDSTEETDGPVLETLFLQSARAINDYYQKGYKIYFWRTVSALEVDFVLYGPRGLLAFEIKRKKNVDGAALKGLRAFKADYPEAKLFLLYGGSQKRYYGDVTAIPFIDALKELPELL